MLLEERQKFGVKTNAGILRKIAIKNMEGGVSIAKYETNWTAEDRYNMLVKMDKIVRACAPLYPIHAIWDKYGGGRRATESATAAWRDEVANDSEKFADALYAFITCLVFDESWINSVIDAENNDER